MAVNLIYAFDNYTFDVDKRELRAAGRVVELQPQVFDLLQFLLATATGSSVRMSSSLPCGADD
jgi:DNA-binding winged helix-turn-helix (wHTH) protein